MLQKAGRGVRLRYVARNNKVLSLVDNERAFNRSGKRIACVDARAAVARAVFPSSINGTFIAQQALNRAGTPGAE